MTPGTYEFWKMVLFSPVVIALAGGLAGSCITLVVALLKFRHDAVENKKIWERQEATRKEERTFDRKSKAYEDFLACFETTGDVGVSNFDKHFAPCIMRLMLYGPLAVKKAARAAFMSLVDAKNYPSASKEHQKHFEELKRYLNDIHTEMIEDIRSHF